MKKLVFCLTLALCLLAASALAQVNPAVDLYLPGNPTTGYSWIAQAEDEGIVEITDQYFGEKSDAPVSGLGGTWWFQFAGIQPGVTSVTLTYARPWEPEGAVYTFVYRLTVDEDLNVLIWGVEMDDAARIVGEAAL